MFVMESLIKIFAYGFIVNGPNSYLRSLSNCLGKLNKINSIKK